MHDLSTRAYPGTGRLRLAIAGVAVVAALATGCTTTPTTAPTEQPTAPSTTAVTTPSAAPTTPPAVRTVAVIKGDPVKAENCNSDFCAHVIVQTAGFPGEVTCQLSSPMYGDWGSTWTQGGDEKRATGRYYGGNDVLTATCDGVTGSLQWT